MHEAVWCSPSLYAQPMTRPDAYYCVRTSSIEMFIHELGMHVCPTQSYVHYVSCFLSALYRLDERMLLKLFALLMGWETSTLARRESVDVE